MFEFLAGRNVLVTGHTGFKGSWLCRMLNEAGANVYGYALAPEYANSPYETLRVRDILCGERIADITDAGSLREFVNNASPDITFHLAAQPLVRRSYSDPLGTFGPNVQGTANVLDCFRGYGKPCCLVCVTTDKVYENKELGVPFVETDRLGGYDPYSASKAASEIVIDSYRKSFFNPADYRSGHLVQLASVRAGNVIGGGDFAEDRIVPDIVRSAMGGKRLKVRSPDSIRPWQHVLEPLTGYIELVDRMIGSPDAKWSSAWNFGPEPDSFARVSEIADMAFSELGNGGWDDASAGVNPHEAGVLKLDISKAKRELGWAPRLSLRETVANTFEWYRRFAAGEDMVDFTERQIEEYGRKA